MIGKIVAVCDGKRTQTSRIDKILKKNKGIYRPELEAQKREKSRKRSR